MRSLDAAMPSAPTQRDSGAGVACKRVQPERAVVLFVDDDGWHCFEQLAAALRKAGIDPIRVMTGAAPRSRYARLVNRMLFRGAILVDAPRGIERLRELVDRRPVLDAQVNEETLARLGVDSDVAHVIEVVSGVPATVRARWLDKLELASRLSARGIPTPAFVAGREATPDEAARRLGYPVVVKRRIGAGGRAVRIAPDRDALVAAVEELGPDPATLLFQGFVPGRRVGYGALRTESGTRAQFTAHETKGTTHPLGPTVMTHTVDDPQLAALGAAVLEELGCRRLAAIEFQEDEHGCHRFIDVSTRAWGGFLSFRAAGVDFAAGYIDDLLHRPAPATTTVAGVSTRVVPAAVRDEATLLPWWRVVIRVGRDLRPYVRPLGWRYAAVVAIGVAAQRRNARRAAPDDEPRPDRAPAAFDDVRA